MSWTVIAMLVDYERGAFVELFGVAPSSRLAGSLNCLLFKSFEKQKQFKSNQNENQKEPLKIK